MVHTPAPPNHPAPGEAELLHALADERLPPDTDPTGQRQLGAAAQDTVQAWSQQRQQLQALAQQQQDWACDIPPAMLHAARHTGRARQQQAQWQRWGGMAAGWLLAFGLGWVGQMAWQHTAPMASAAPPAQVMPRFAQQAAVAHAVYQPEQRHPVEVEATQQAHLVQWLSKRLGRQLSVPDLSAQGYGLVGGRLLPGDGGARAQFMYQDPAGRRITLYLGALDDPQLRGATAFQFSDDGPVPSFYWADQGFGYALSGALSRPALLILATAVHRQL